MPHSTGSFNTNTAENFAVATGQANEFVFPEIYSKNVQIAFRKSSVAEAICNTDYFGEIASYGDTVNIIKEPTITTYAYSRSGTITNSALSDQELVLTIDQTRAFQFQIDDLETRFSNVNWQALAADNAAYQLKDQMDQNVLAAIIAGADTGNNYGSEGSAIQVGHASGETDPLDVLARQARLLDEDNVPEENRWVVAGPVFYEELALTNSKLLSVDYNQGSGGLRNGLVAEGKLRGFQLYKSNNLPTTEAGGTAIDAALPGGTAVTGTGFVIAGHMSAVACASALNKVEVIRSTTSFEDIVRGLLVWGRKVLRPEALSVARVAYE